MHTNREGLTWAEWIRAAGRESQLASFSELNERQLQALRSAWKEGDDPSEYRATAPRRLTRSRNRQSDKFLKGDRVKTKLGRGPGTVVKADYHHAYVKFDADGDRVRYGTKFQHEDLVAESSNRGRNRQSDRRSDPHDAAVARSAVGPGVYRRIEVKLTKVEPGHYQIYATRWLAGSGRKTEHLGGHDVHGTADQARKTARTMAERLEAEFPDHRVELVL